MEGAFSKYYITKLKLTSTNILKHSKVSVSFILSAKLCYTDCYEITTNDSILIIRACRS